MVLGGRKTRDLDQDWVTYMGWDKNDFTQTRMYLAYLTFLSHSGFQSLILRTALYSAVVVLSICDLWETVGEIAHLVLFTGYHP